MNKIVAAVIGFTGISILTFAPVNAADTSTPQEAETMTTQSAPADSASNSNISEQSAQSPTVETKEFSGKIIKVDNESLVIDTDQGTKEFKISSDILIERNTSTATPDQLKPGDKVTVKAEGDQALSVAATAGSTIDKLVKYALIALGLLILLLIVKSVIKKRNKSFITTTPTNISKGQ